MKPVLALARPEILTLTPYSHAAWLPHLTRLHANEAPWRPAGDATAGGLNRYPEPQPAELIARLAELYGVPAASVLATRGSDEAIDVLSRIYLRASQDAIIHCPPTFGMYAVAARIQGAAVIDVPLSAEHDWQVDPEQLLSAMRPNVKLVYLCSPNNPTANLLREDVVLALCSALDGRAIVVVDEAYIELTARQSVTRWLSRFPTLAVLRTLSKAYALAGARVGALIAAPELIEVARRILPPYCLAQPTIEAVLTALSPPELRMTQARVANLLLEREYLRDGLARLALVERIWPSDTNFLLIESSDAGRLLRACLAGGSIVRDLRANPALARALRITVGTRAENDALLNSLDAA